MGVPVCIRKPIPSYDFSGGGGGSGLPTRPFRLFASRMQYIVYRSIKKFFRYAIFQKFFHIFIIHSWSMFYNTYYEMFMPFCFYKSYQRIIRQHFYISIKYIPMKNTTAYFKYILMKTQQHLYVYSIKSKFLCISLCFHEICNSTWH